MVVIATSRPGGSQAPRGFFERCRICGRAKGPNLAPNVVPTARVAGRMKDGECWYCATGLAPMSKARGGLEPPKEA